MKYGISVNGRLTEVLEIPNPLPFGGNVAGFLAKQFPTLATASWHQVPDDAFNGTLDRGNGDFENPAALPAEAFPTLSGAQFIALVSSVLGFARLDLLLRKSESIRALLIKAESVDRFKGNTPVAIAYLKTGDDKLTDEELALIDDAWRAIGTPG